MKIDLSIAITPSDIEAWKHSIETENIEFKTAANNFSTEDLGKYCAALANEGGGRIVFGMTPERPRVVVGSTAFADLERTRSGLIRDLRIPVRVDEVVHPDIQREGVKVVVFSVGRYNPGEPVAYKGHYFGREGDGLTPLSFSKLRAIIDERADDVSSQVCTNATLDDLDETAIEVFRKQWSAKSRNTQILTLSVQQLLRDAELLTDGLTYAALLLLGTRAALTRHLAAAEIIWEFRSPATAVTPQLRESFRAGFLVFHDALWKLINERNYAKPVQQDFFMADVPPFNERATREAIANAWMHRDYRLQGSIFVRQSPHELIVLSPGGFPPGINLENILDEQLPRNRRLAEVAERCRLVERSGQGVDLLFQNAIKESKALPDYSQTTSTRVCLALDGIVRDPKFLAFLERAGNALLEQLSTLDFLTLDAVNRGLSLSQPMKVRAANLVTRGLLEKFGRGKGRRFILSRALCEAGGTPAAYTKNKGLERETRKQLFLQHIRDFDYKGSTLAELRAIEPSMTYDQARDILKELKKAELIDFRGSHRWGRWHMTQKQI